MAKNYVLGIGFHYDVTVSYKKLGDFGMQMKLNTTQLYTTYTVGEPNFGTNGSAGPE